MYVYFEGDEHAYLRYNQLARAGERPSSRNVRQSRARRPGERRGVSARRPHGLRGQPAERAHRHDPRSRGARQQGRPVHARHVCARAVARQRRARSRPDRGARHRHRPDAELRAGARRRKQARIPSGGSGTGAARSAYCQQGPEIRRESSSSTDCSECAPARRSHPSGRRWACRGRSRRTADSARHEHFFLLHRSTDLRVGALDHHRGRRSRRAAAAAGERVPGSRATDGRDHRPLSGCVADDDRRNRHHSARAADQRRRACVVSELVRQSGRQLHRSR